MSADFWDTGVIIILTLTIFISTVAGITCFFLWYSERQVRRIAEAQRALYAVDQALDEAAGGPVVSINEIG
jgi:hypothetical protein